MKKVISFICVAAITLSFLPVFAEPEDVSEEHNKKGLIESFEDKKNISEGALAEIRNLQKAQLKVKAEQVLEKDKNYSNLTEDERQSVTDYYCLNSEHMADLEKSGYTTTQSVPLAITMQKLDLTVSEIDTLVSLYVNLDELKHAADLFYDYTNRFGLIPETFIEQKELLLQGADPDKIFKAYCIAKTFNAEFSEVYLTNKSEQELSVILAFSNEEKQMLSKISTDYNVKISFLVDYIEENGLTIEDFNQQITDRVQPMAAGTTNEGFELEVYAVSPYKYEDRLNIGLRDGNVTYKSIPVVLPGKGGLDLEIGAHYNSAESKRGVYTYRLANTSGQYTTGNNSYASLPVTALNNFAYGWNFNFSRVYTPGIETYRILELEDGRSFTFPIPLGKDPGYVFKLDGPNHEDISLVYKYSHNTPSGSTTYRYALFYSNGKMEFFDDRGRLNKIEDRFGNSINFSYVSDDNVTITDTLGRITTIVRTDNAVTVTLPDQNTIVYNLQDATVSNEVGTETFKNVSQIVNQEDEVTAFVYANGILKFNFFHSFAGVKAEEITYSRITQITYPTGGIVTCAFETGTKPLIEGYQQITKATEYEEKNYSIIYNNAVYSIESGSSSTSSTNIILSDKKIYNSVNQYGQVTDEKTTDLNDVTYQRVSTSYLYGTDKPTFRRKFYRDDSTKYSSESYEYDTLKRKIKETIGEYSATYTYGANDIILTKTYKQNEDTTILEENTLSEDGKKIIKTTIKKNGQICRETNYEYDMFGNITKETVNPSPSERIITEYVHAYKNDGTFTVTKKVKNAGVNNTDIISVTKYDVLGRVYEKTDGKGNTTGYTYDNIGRILNETKPGNVKTSYSYGILSTEITRPNNGKTKYVYDMFGRLRQISNNINGRYRYAFDFRYDECGRVNYKKEYRHASDSQASQSYFTSYTYDSLDRVLSEVVSKSNVLSQKDYAYDSTSSDTLNYVTQTVMGDESITEPAKTVSAYDLFGRLVSEVTYNGDTEYSRKEYAYDYLDNIITIKDNASIDNSLPYTVQYEYDIFNQVTKELDIDGNATTYTYDNLGRMLSETRPSGMVYHYGYDKMGNISSSYAMSGSKKSLEKALSYDANGNLIKEINKTDADTYSVVENEYDALNQLTKVKSYRETTRDGSTDGLTPEVTSYAYDKMGNVTSMQVGIENPSITTYTYDVLGRCISKTDANGKTETYEYDMPGNMVKKTDRNGTVFQYTYNENNQPLQTTAQKGDETDSITNEYNTLGLRTKMTDSGGVTTYGYDFMGRVTQMTDANGATITYGYDNRNNRTSYYSQVGANVVSLQNTYDTKNRLTEQNGLTMLRTNIASIASTFAYDKADHLQTKTLNGAVTTYTYAVSSDDLTSVSVNHNGTVFREDYTYDLQKNIKQAKRNGAYTATNIVSENTYFYDGRNRLQTEMLAVGGNKGLLENRLYGFDERGNIQNVEKSSDNPETESETHEYDLNNRQSDAGYVYDDNGNLLQTPNGESMSYDLFNRMASYSKDGRTWTYTYNGDNLRTSKTGGGVTTLFFWDGGNMYLEKVGENYNSYIYGVGLNYSSDSTGHIHAYNTNALGDVVSYKNAGGSSIEYAGMSRKLCKCNNLLNNC